MILVNIKYIEKHLFHGYFKIDNRIRCFSIRNTFQDKKALYEIIDWGEGCNFYSLKYKSLHENKL